MFTFDVPAGWLALLNPYWIPINFLLIGGLLALAWAAYRRPAAGVAGVAACLPLYLARSRFGWLPTTYVELAILAAVGGWVCHGLKRGGRWQVDPDPLRLPALALLASGTVALLWSPDLRTAAGLWKTYLVEPILLYAVARRSLQTEADRRLVAGGLALSGGVVAAAALWQWFTGVGIAEAGWVPFPQRRVTAHYTSPNAVGLFLGPLLGLLGGWLATHRLPVAQRLGGFALLTLGISAVGATKSAGTWLGLAAAALLLAAVKLGRRRTLALAAVGVTILMAAPAIRARMSAPFSDAAAQNRLTLWRGTLEYLTSSPSRFLQGAGIAGFGVVHERFRNPRLSEPLIYPHNIVLNVWVEYGLAGLAAAMWLTVRVSRRAARARRGDGSSLRLGAVAALAAIVVHGLVDVSYFKNDLAALTWLLLALALPSTPAENPTPPATSPPKYRKESTITASNFFATFVTKGGAKVPRRSKI